MSCTMTDETHGGGCSTSVLISRNQEQSGAPDEAFAASTPKRNQAQSVAIRRNQSHLTKRSRHRPQSYQCSSVAISRNQSQSVAPDEAFAASTPKLAWSAVR